MMADIHLPISQSPLEDTRPMANTEQIEIVSPTGQVRFYNLNPAVGIVNIGQHQDNDVVLAGQEIRPFHALIDHRKQPYQFVSLEEDGGFGAERPFSEWERLKVGGHEMILVKGREGASGSPFGNPSPTNDYTQEPVGEPLPPDETTQAHWRARPGQTVYKNLTIKNSGSSQATFVISSDGVPEEWVWFSQRTIVLDPGGQATAQMGVTPPVGPDTKPGLYPLAWQMESPDYPSWIQSEDIYLQVDAAATVEMSKPEPANLKSRPFRRTGLGHITIANWGNVPAQVYLSGQERRDDCTVQIDPVVDPPGLAEGIEWDRPQFDGLIHTGDLLLLLPPGSLAHLQVTLKPKARRWFGTNIIHHRFTVSAQSPDGIFATKTTNGTFESRAAIRINFLLLVIILLVLTTYYFFGSDLAAKFGRAGTESVAIGAIDGENSPAWLAPTSDAVPLLLRGTGGAADRTREDMTYTEMFQDVATLYGLDWRQLASHANRESLLNPNAVGSAGEYGFMQILPTTWDEWAPLVQVTDPWDPYSNILVGAAYYSYIHSYFSDLGFGDPKWALAAYNWGPERTLGVLGSRVNVDNWQLVPLTQRMYVADILIGLEQIPDLVKGAETRYPRP